MPGIFPDIVNGALVIRNAEGDCLSPAGVVSAFCPPETFTTNCLITALPSDCTARISAAQINAIVSEILCLASTMDPTGSWDCEGLCNLAQAFTAWEAALSGDFALRDLSNTIGPRGPLPLRVPDGAPIDYNTLLEMGFWAMPPGGANAPEPTAYYLVQNWVFESGSNDVIQYATNVLADGGASSLRWRRTRDSGVWSAWFRVYETATEIQALIVPSFDAWIASDQTTATDVALTQNVWTDVAMSTSAFKGAAFGTFATPTFTFTKAGTYNLQAMLPVQNIYGSGNPLAATRLLFNGTTPEPLTFNAPGGVASGTGQLHGHPGHLMFDAAIGDTIKYQVWVNNGTSGVIARTTSFMWNLRPRIMITKIR